MARASIRREQVRLTVKLLHTAAGFAHAAETDTRSLVGVQQFLLLIAADILLVGSSWLDYRDRREAMRLLMEHRRKSDGGNDD
ncbi:MAG: hypothetical protein HY329_13830 [Chloroflexi bacterium]|nr:hypothetical protein [Chloroflexota bacterium]